MVKEGGETDLLRETDPPEVPELLAGADASE